MERLAPSRIPEVAAFTAAQKELVAWRAQFPDAAAALDELAVRYNATREAADKVVRLRLVECGPFELHQFRRKDNAEALYTAVGRQKFSSLGGTLKVLEELKVDREKFDALVAQDKIDAELVASVVKYEPAYRRVPELVVP